VRETRRGAAKRVSDGDNTRPEAEIFEELYALCTSSGYVHAIAYFCWRDNLIRFSGTGVIAQDLWSQHSPDKLIRTEISTLIGLMVRQPIEMSLPASDRMQNYIDRTETLLRELHRAMEKPWFEGWKEVGKVPEQDPFDNAAAMREPIFYGGDSAYDFQYRDLAPLKYRADNDWLEANKGFRIADACKVAQSLANLHLERQIECAQLLKDKPPNERTILPAFMFTTEDAVQASGVARKTVDRLLDAFSCGSDERNTLFTRLNEFNVTNSKPILKIKEGSYILLQHYSLLEAVYETPFFWMNEDKTYAQKALTNRGHFTEEFAANRLEAVFGAACVFRNVEIYKGKNRFAEADSLVLYGDRAIVIQAKSKRLTIEARKGNDLQLKDDFKKAIQNAYDQALLCAEALTHAGFRFVAPSGTEIVIGGKPKVVFPVCIVSDHYPALTFQARQFLRAAAKPPIQPPLVTDIFALDAFAEMLSTPLHFLNYLTLRARFGDKLIVPNEWTVLGFHLKYNLWLDAKYDLASLTEDFAADLDIAMLARRNGLAGKRTPEGILTRFDNLTIGRLLATIEATASPMVTGLGLLLLQIGTETAKFLSAGIDRIAHEAREDGQSHDISTTANAADSGLTVHCNVLPEDAARERLSVHCKVRKYDTKANAWYGLLLDPTSGAIRAALTIEGDWKPDPQMDTVMKSWPKRTPVPISQLSSGWRKVGRNEPCPCGSGRKYKKCCMGK
jgi:SEC-C motif/Nuclease-related domain